MNIQRMIRFQVCLIVTILALTVSAASAATVPAGFTESPVASGLASPTAMQFAPDGRLFVCEQGGRLRVIKNGALLSTPFVTLTVNAEGERGLLGVAFDPDFATNRYVYVYYTATTPTVHNRISRFTANGDVAVAGSEVVIFDLDNLSGATNHNGGALAFGPDGKLYAAVGENANGGARAVDDHRVRQDAAPQRRRLDSRPTTRSTATTSGKNRAIWALGLRNPFTFAFNPVGHRDVHQRRGREHVGGNQRRPRRRQLRLARHGGADERSALHQRRATPTTTASGVRDHRRRLLRAADGAVSQRLRQRLLLRGLLRRLDPEARSGAGNSVAGFATGISSPVDLKVSDDGSLYYLARGTGATTGVVVRIIRATSSPTITTHPAIGDRGARRRRSPSAWTRPARRRCGISGSATGSTSPARPRKTYTIVASSGRQRRAVPRGGQQRLRERAQQRSRADRDRQPGADRDDHPAGRRHAVQRRHDDQLCGHGDGSGRRDAAGERVHLAGGLPSRHPHASVPAAHHRRQQRVVRHPDDRPYRRQRVVPHLPDGAGCRRAHAHHRSATSCHALPG